MKPAPFDYHRPNSSAEALQMLGTLENAKLLAGGQSLVAMLNMRYVMVDHLIDINRIPDLAGLRFDGDRLTVGAMTRQCDLLADVRLRERAPVFAEALNYVGHLQTRNRGTVGGSIGHMDPAAELMGLATLLDATVHVAKSSGTRDIPIADYPVGFLTPSLDPDEMISAVTFEMPATRHGSCFLEFAPRHGDFAIVGVGCVLEGVPAITRASIVVIGLDVSPVRLTEAEAVLLGQAPDQAAIEAAATCARGVEALDDAAASGAYRQRLAATLTRRALTTAAARLQGDNR